MHEGQRVFIMTPEQWAQYNYDFNESNKWPQPQKLLDEMAQFKIERRKREIAAFDAY